MKSLTPLLAFSFLIGCDGEKSNVAPSKDSPEEAATEAPSERSLEVASSEDKPPEAVSVNPNLKYEIKGDAVTITGCAEDASGELIIPAMIEGKPVTSIGNEAFKDCKSLTNITIGNGVTSIGRAAFFKCSKLTSITIGNGVTSIGGNAFFGCIRLTSITIGNGVTSIERNAFCFCESLTSITIPDGVTSIGDWAFYYCTSLTSIAIPDSVTSIGVSSFERCTKLTSIAIPDSVTSIGESAFVLCSSLTSITIPDSVTSIGDWAFYQCTNLSAVTFLGDAPKIEDKAFEDSSPTIYRKPEAKGWGDTLAGRPVIDREQADFRLDNIEKADRNTKKHEEGEIAAKDVDDFEKFDESKMEEVVKNFVTAESPAEVKKYIRNSERVGPLLDRYYERADYEAVGFEALDMSQMKYNGDVVTMLVQKADFLSSPIAVERVVDGEEESYQIDWESWVGYCDYTPEQMRAEKPDKPFLMRVIVKPTNYYNYDFSDDVKWRSLGLELKDSIDSFIGYVERDSEQDKKFRVMMKGGQVVACMVRVAYPTGSRSKDQVEILEIVGSGWLQNLKKDK